MVKFVRLRRCFETSQFILRTYHCRQSCRQWKNLRINQLVYKELLPNLSRILFYGEKMKQYIFTEQEFQNEYRYIFLCGSRYLRSSKKDKRNVLREFLKKENINYRPIILEDNFMFRSKTDRFLLYDDIYMKDLYQVEMVTNYLSDNNIIIHESISTGAETGLFLSEEGALKKTCLLLPDETAIEENKLGQFIRLAFFKEPNSAKMIRFYPRIEKNILSNDVKFWHTYFVNDKIGENLGNQIINFLEKEDLINKIKFTRTKEKVEEGFIHYKKRNSTLEITLLPRVFLNCVASIFNIDELSKKVFSSEGKRIKDYIEDIKMCLNEVFIQTISEKTGEDFKQCSVQVKMNVKRVYISSIIGMCLYLFQAAGFIEILKTEDYVESNKVKIARKMVLYHDGSKQFFYSKYAGCIGQVIDTQIV